MESNHIRTSSGFTLVELLVVIALISLLIAMLLPVLSQARERARGIACASQLRQVTFAALAYSSEHNGLRSTYYYEPGVAERIYSQLLVRSGYLPDYDVMRCPSAGPYEHVSNIHRYVYGVTNAATYPAEYLFGTPPNPQPSRGTNFNAIKRPTEYVLSADTLQLGSGAHHMRQWHILMVYDDGNQRGMHTRHSGSGNVAFADGHVEVLGPEAYRDKVRILRNYPQNPILGIDGDLVYREF